MRRPQRVHNSNSCRHIIIRCNNREFNLARHQRRDLMLNAIQQAKVQISLSPVGVRIMSSNVFKREYISVVAAWELGFMWAALMLYGTGKCC